MVVSNIWIIAGLSMKNLLFSPIFPANIFFKARLQSFFGHPVFL